MKKARKLFSVWIKEVISFVLLCSGFVILIYPIMSIFYPVSEIYPCFSEKVGIALSVFLFADGFFLLGYAVFMRIRCRMRIYFLADLSQPEQLPAVSFVLIKRFIQLKIYYGIFCTVKRAVFYFPAGAALYVILFLFKNEEYISRNVLFILLFLFLSLVLTGNFFSLCLNPHKAYGEYLLFTSPLQSVKVIFYDTVFIERKSTGEKIGDFFSFLWGSFLRKTGIILPLVRQYGIFYSAKKAVKLYYGDQSIPKAD